MASRVEELPSDDEGEAPVAAPVADAQAQADAEARAAEERRLREAQQAADDEAGEGIDMEAVARLKTRGNHLFVAGDYEGALRLYDIAADRAVHKPAPSPEIDRPRAPGDGDDGAAAAGEAGAAEAPAAAAAEVDTTDYTLTSQVYCNAGACCVKLGRTQEAVDRLSAAITHAPDYEKALYRRAGCYWDLEQWASCHGDLDRCAKLGMRLSAEDGRRLAFSKQRMDEEMAKMLGQLKDLGNMFLGKFGMSTDNFKFDKDPATGGYSMRYESNPGGK